MIRRRIATSALNSMDRSTCRKHARVDAFVFVIGLVSTLVVIPATMAGSVDVNITADNGYEFAFGSSTGINQSVQGPVNNTLNGDIFSCGTPGPEHYSAIPASAGDFMYVVAINDGSVTQGVLGQVSFNGGAPFFSGTNWQVYDTGISGSPAAFPSVATINAYIAAANAGTGPASGSKGWVSSAGAGTTGAVGVLAIGEDNSDAGGDFGIACQSGPSGIGPSARWMWYNPNPATISDPFQTANTPGHGTNVIIFRVIPASVPFPAVSLPATAVLILLMAAGLVVWTIRQRTS